MVIDAGIDWDARIGAGWIARFSASPAFEAGSSLLYGAAELWKGRYGVGRLVRKDAESLGYRMSDMGKEWRRAALNRVPDVFPEGAFNKDAAHLMTRYLSVRGFALRYGQPAPEKHPVAARRLVRTAIVATERHLETIRITGDLVGDYGKDAMLWEDRFEKIGESPFGVPPDDDVPEDAYGPFARYGVYRVIRGLWDTVGTVHVYAEGRPDWDRPLAKEYAKERDRWGEAESRAYDEYVARATRDPDERSALLAVRDTSSPGSDLRDAHWSGKEVMADTVVIASLYTTVLLQTIGRAEEQPDWSRRLVTDRLRMPTLPDPDKKNR